MTVTWNGTTITGPVLIYQDELVRDDRTNVLATPVDGTLICRSENQAQVGWHFAPTSTTGTGGLVQTSTSSNHFRQRRTSSSATPSVSRLTTNRPDEALTSAAANGLWSCRLNAGFSTTVPVGIYARGGGESSIYTKTLSNWVHIIIARDISHTCLIYIIGSWLSSHRSWCYLCQPSLSHFLLISV